MGLYIKIVSKRLLECGNLRKIEVDVGLMVQLTERLETPQYYTQIVIDTSLNGVILIFGRYFKVRIFVYC